MQLRHIPTVGTTGLIESYLDAWKFARSGRELVQEGYSKVGFQYCPLSHSLKTVSYMALLSKCPQSADIWSSSVGLECSTTFVKPPTTSCLSEKRLQRSVPLRVSTSEYIIEALFLADTSDRLHDRIANPYRPVSRSSGADYLDKKSRKPFRRPRRRIGHCLF